MRLRIADYVFIIIYLIVLIVLLVVTPITMVGGTGSGPQTSTPLWVERAWLLAYIIAAPLLYYVIRKYLYPKKKKEQS